jgi:galactokinase
MTARELLRRLDDPASAKILSRFYEDPGAAQKRAKSLVQGLVENFLDTGETVRLFSAPGRTELGGNHTDHNQGKVLAASIQLDILAAVSPRKDKKVVFRSTGFDDIEMELSSLSVKSSEKESTRALIRGTAAALAVQGTEAWGFTANAGSLVLPGSGLSSSAAVEVLIGCIFDRLFGGGRRNALEIAKIGRWAENEYFGKPSGLMDQAACASGGTVAMDFRDPENPELRGLPFDPEASGFSLCVVNTRGNHTGLVSDYAAIPAEMKAVAAVFGKSVLRELEPRAVLERCGELRSICGDRAVLRALHFFEENRRVSLMTRALEELNDAKAGKFKIMERFLSLVNQSGASSCMLLQNIYAPGNPGEQGISLALALTRDFLRNQSSGAQRAADPCPGPAAGACRVHGGGFAGTIQAYIPLESLSAYTERMEAVFGSGAVTPLRIRPTGVTEIELYKQRRQGRAAKTRSGPVSPAYRRNGPVVWLAIGLGQWPGSYENTVLLSGGKPYRTAKRKG